MKDWNTRGMISPTSMYIDPITREVLGPSIPKKADGIAAWVERVNGEWIEVTDRKLIKEIIAWRYPKKKTTKTNRMGGREV
jgi:hypothetical protein